MSTKFATKTGRVAAGGSLLVGGVAGALVLAPEAGAATTFHVTNTADSGAGSLRQAVLEANTNPGADIIVFDASSAGTITLTSGEIDIAGDVTITGLGAANSIISGNHNSRIFYIYNAAASLTVSISGVTMTEGWSKAGGAIVNWGNDLTLSGVVLSGNTSVGGGGAIQSAKSSSPNTDRYAPLTIIDSEISQNTSDGNGGGLDLYFMGDTTITNTVISGNTSNTGNGGGASFYQVRNISLVSSTVSGNSSYANGGGVNVSHAHNISIANSSFQSNRTFYNAGGGGASIKYADVVTIDSTTFDQNSASGDGGALYATHTDVFTMMNSTISGNHAIDGAGLELGDNGNALIANSTIANNVGDPLSGNGGALYSWGANGLMRIEFSTISGNSTKFETVMLVADSPNSVDIIGTILSDNTTQDGSGTQAVDLKLTGSASATLTNSLIMGSTLGGSFTDGGGNIHGVSAQLGALADNGGATFTMQPAAGSPVIDAGPLSWTAFAGEGFDQRATPYVRVYNGQSDMGAVEVQSEPTPPSTTTTVVPGDTTTTVGTDPVAPAFTG